MTRTRGAIVTILLVGWLVASCTWLAPSRQRLRLTNAGEVDIEDLTVIFPGGEVDFGKVAAGDTTEYLEFENGVYDYAAYELTVDGKTVIQGVDDWVGDSPMEGEDFTYMVEFNPDGNPGNWIELRLVSKD